MKKQAAKSLNIVISEEKKALSSHENERASIKCCKVLIYLLEPYAIDDVNVDVRQRVVGSSG